MQIGERQVDYSDGFRVFFATRDAALQLPPTAGAIVQLVNFTTTRAGLSAQVLLEDKCAKRLSYSSPVARLYNST